MIAAVYLLHDHEGCVLYVGASVTPQARLAAHKRKPWGQQIARMTIVGTFPRHLAKQIEHDTIYALQPPYNVASKDGLRAVEKARLVAAQRRFVRDDITKIKASAA